MSIDVLIFSKDRPAQLDLLLRSIERYALKLYRGITIQWSASSPEYERGYELLAREHVYGYMWQRDRDATSFRESVRAWLRGDHDLISFLVDDDVFYRPLVFDRTTACQSRGYSFRGGDYDYPFSVDGVIYRREWIEKLLTGAVYGNPTQLEAVGDARRDRLPFATLEPGWPCLTGLPWNRVSADSGMPHEGRHEFDFNERFLAGSRLMLPDFPLSQPPHTYNITPIWESVAARA